MDTPTKSVYVTSNGQLDRYEADSFETEGGYLVVKLGCQTVALFAPGNWSWASLDPNQEKSSARG